MRGRERGLENEREKGRLKMGGARGLKKGRWRKGPMWEFGCERYMRKRNRGVCVCLCVSGRESQIDYLKNICKYLV